MSTCMSTSFRSPSASCLLLVCIFPLSNLRLFHPVLLQPPKFGIKRWLGIQLKACCCMLYTPLDLSCCVNGRHHLCYIAGVSRGYQWFISVAGEVEGGYLGLAPLQLHHPLLGRQALVQLVHSHYMRAALPGLINMLGSSNVLGKQCVWSVSGKVARRHSFKLAKLGAKGLQGPGILTQACA